MVVDAIVEGGQLSGLWVVVDILLNLGIWSLVELIILTLSSDESGIDDDCNGTLAPMKATIITIIKTKASVPKEVASTIYVPVRACAWLVFP